MRRVKCQNCIHSRRLSRYEVLCRVYRVLKIPHYRRICSEFRQRRRIIE